MGSRRIGLARTQALVQQLKRDLTMGGSTFEDSKLLGKSYVSASGDTNAPGPGLQSGSVTGPVMRVQEVNGEVITTITLDLQGLSGSTSAGGLQVMGNAESASDPAYLYQHQDSINGILYKAELSCIELITAGGGDNTRNFCLSASTLGTYGHGQVAASMGDPFCVMAPEAAITKGQTIVDTFVSSSDNAYVYIVNGVAATGSSGGQYTGGKLVFRLYGHKDF